MGNLTDEQGGKLSTLDDNNLDIVGADDWYDLFIGDRAIVKGKIVANHLGQSTISLVQPDWQDILIHLQDETGLTHSFPTSTHVTVLVERSEDGLVTWIKDIQLSS